MAGDESQEVLFKLKSEESGLEEQKGMQKEARSNVPGKGTANVKVLNVRRIWGAQRTEGSLGVRKLGEMRNAKT